MLSEQWENAACRDVDPEVMFPTATDSTDLGRHEVAVAKAVCRRCPVQARCLEWALVTGQDYGVWGGTSENERRAMRRQDILVDTA